MFSSISVLWRMITLLILSNCFMTAAWYGLLRYRTTLPLGIAIISSWLIALPEYAFQVPANRMGYGPFSGYQLKIIQEAISIVVFMRFAWFWLGEAPTWRYGAALALILGAVGILFSK